MFVAFRLNRSRILIFIGLLIIGGIGIGLHKTASHQNPQSDQNSLSANSNIEIENPKKDFIKWVDFAISTTAMEKAMKLDIESVDEAVHIDWIEILAYLGAKYGGDFSRFNEKDLNSISSRIKNGEKVEDITKDMKYYSYYYEAYNAVLGEFLGNFTIQQPDKNNNPVWVQKYGLKVFSPIAQDFGYSHYDDFGSSRSYGYKRRHLGHDMMGSVGTPIIAVESGFVEAIGWNQYGGWRIGIRSFDKKRYYYYAHLRKDHPYIEGLGVGSIVKAGDVIGYLGMTGYSTKENVNNIDTPHLHFGIQLIFDESQKEGNNEIWIDCYEITKLLSKNKSAVIKDEQSSEYRRKFDFFEALVENIE